MKIRRVKHNNHKKAFEVTTAKATYSFPYAKVEPPPRKDDPIASVVIDRELAREAFTYVLESGAEGSAHIDQVLEYNRDPSYMRDLMVYELTLEAKKRIDSSPLSRREIIRRLSTSPSQLYRLLDPTNYRKSIDQLLRLLHVLDCQVDVVVREKSA